MTQHVFLGSASVEEILDRMQNVCICGQGLVMEVVVE